AGDDTMSLTLFVALAPTITYASTALPDGLVGAAYSETLTADGDATIVWTVDSGALPDGLALSPAGVISGTPTANGTFNFDVKAENSVGDDTMSLTLFVALAPTITYASATLPDGLVGAAYSETLTADGDATIVWTVDSGALPDGLTLSSDGIISGTPTANGTFSFVVKAENGVGDDTMSLSMFVALSPTITTASPLPRGILGLAYSETLTADGDATISWSIDSGDLPDGLTMSSDGIISGTPTVNGTFSFVVKAENSVGDDTMSISLFVALSPTIRSFSIALPEGTVGTEYELDLAADGDSTITWTLDSGALPDGLTLSPDGIISGTPTAKGVFDFVVRATNSAGTDTMAMTIKVNYKDNTLTVISVTVLSLLALLAVGFVVEGSGKGK
ncbi:MAG: putative Ig domain-containing protein, partial [Methanomassiliicoccaceae archaeon]|nr:putative Ig domain-containing protein [Methanomassiliicoccaceae archaeon]